MIQTEGQKDLDLVADDVIKRLRSMSSHELCEQKRWWEESICNDRIDSPLQSIRLKALRSISKEIESRREDARTLREIS